MSKRYVRELSIFECVIGFFLAVGLIAVAVMWLLS